MIRRLFRQACLISHYDFQNHSLARQVIGEYVVYVVER